MIVTGSNLVPAQSYAAAAGDSDNGGDYKSTKDYKDSIHKDINAKSRDTNQHSSQDKLCYRDDNCEQASEGEQIKGKDNSAEGFNDQSKSIEQQPAVTTPPILGTPRNGTAPTTSTLTVTKHVECNFTPSSDVQCPTADTFNITATPGNGSSYAFSGSESGTPLTINPPFPAPYQVTETDALQGFVVATIPVGSGPTGVAFNEDNGFVYVANTNSNTVSVINPATNTVVATIPVGSTPLGVAFNADNGFMYVTNANSNTVSVINPATNTVTATIPVGSQPRGVAFNPNNGYMYVANFGGSAVSVINPSTNTVVGTIPVGLESAGIAFNPDNGNMHVTTKPAAPSP